MGVILRLDVMGWQGDPPGLPDPPLRIAPGEAGSVSYYYDYSPPHVEQTVPDFCLRIMGRLRRALLPPSSPFTDHPLAIRAVLDMALAVPDKVETYSYAWPVEFVQILADAEVKLSLTHYVLEFAAQSSAAGLIIED
ncbi:MAG: hypothetical protein EBY21_02690 [Alphaproteobacteria bacterium]|nr:hypothetical protein [Alphaproteobacteria bacterium]